MLPLPGGFIKPQRTQGVVLKLAWCGTEGFYHEPGRLSAESKQQTRVGRQVCITKFYSPYPDS
ncbi:hypothetical protein PANT111_90213 [Pantoea brenneri]|uniref:Transposase n=1 Tax=Pantoea brenneri TaxID=472694 RepID=A0AAX3JDE6_9GAMM|nr:hypothetical protein PANT111_90213 [Pantoea brenneri]